MKWTSFAAGMVFAAALGGVMGHALSQPAPEKIQGQAVVPIAAGASVYHTCKRPDGNAFLPTTRAVSAFPTVLAIWC